MKNVIIHHQNSISDESYINNDKLNLSRLFRALVSEINIKLAAGPGVKNSFCQASQLCIVYIHQTLSIK